MMLSARKFNQFDNFLRLAQREEVKILPGANTILFGPESWNFINNFVEAINDSFAKVSLGKKLNNQPLIFSTIVRNPTGFSGLHGGALSLAKISLELWKYLTESRAEVYSKTEAQEIAKELSNKINDLSFPELQIADTKSKLNQIINNWLIILK